MANAITVKRGENEYYAATDDNGNIKTVGGPFQTSAEANQWWQQHPDAVGYPSANAPATPSTPATAPAAGGKIWQTREGPKSTADLDYELKKAGWSGDYGNPQAMFDAYQAIDTSKRSSGGGGGTSSAYGASGSTGGATGPYDSELVNVQYLDLLRQTKNDAANEAYRQKYLEEIEKRKLDVDQQRADQEARSIALEAAKAASQEAASMMQILASLRGPSNAFKQAEVQYGMNQAGVSKMFDALAGKYSVPSFGALQGTPEAASLQTLARDTREMGGQNTGWTPFDTYQQVAQGNVNPEQQRAANSFDYGALYDKLVPLGSQYRTQTGTRWTPEQWAAAATAQTGLPAAQAQALATAVYQFLQQNGRGPDRNEIQNLAKSLNLGGQVPSSGYWTSGMQQPATPTSTVSDAQFNQWLPGSGWPEQFGREYLREKGALPSGPTGLSDWQNWLNAKGYRDPQTGQATGKQPGAVTAQTGQQAAGTVNNAVAGSQQATGAQAPTFGTTQQQYQTQVDPSTTGGRTLTSGGTSMPGTMQPITFGGQPLTGMDRVRATAAALPATNKIVGREFFKLTPDMQQFTLAAAEARGESAGDALHTIKQGLPRFAAPSWARTA